MSDVDYVLPLRWTTDEGLGELTAYLRELSRYARVIVVDGSPPDLFEHHRQQWAGLVTHVPPQPDGFLNGKVTGVHTGLRLATAERVVIADDDVRYDAESLRRTVALLDTADLVGPQNVFDPMPWHAAWDTSRSLLNRAVAADYPGTFAVRRSTFLRMGGYSGDVLFENLELMRTVRANGGTVARPRDIYVARLPPSQEHFLGQRVRQAFDDLAQPWRLATFLPVLPAALSGRRGRRAVGVGLVGSVLLAEVGRRRAGGSKRFPRRTVLFAPAWVLERSVCVWLALGQRVFLGGVRYAGQRLPTAASSPRDLRLRRAGTSPLVAPGSPEPTRSVRPVAEGLAAGAAASAQRNGAAAGVDLAALVVDHAEGAAHQQRTVAVGRDDGDVRVLVLGTVVHHGRSAARDKARETVSPNE